MWWSGVSGMAYPVGRWLAQVGWLKIGEWMVWTLGIAALVVILSALAGCANTGRATDDIRIMVGDVRATITRFEARQGETTDDMRDLVRLTQTVLAAAEAGAAGIDAIKDAELADFKAAGLAAVQAGATSLMGPGVGGLVADYAPLLLAGLFGADSLKQRKKRGQAEAAKREALATTPPKPEPTT